MLASGKMKHSEDLANSSNTPIKILAISSGGGHWIQLLRMRPAWADCIAVYATTDEGYRKDVQPADRGEAGAAARFYVIPDASRWQKLRLIQQLLAITILVVREMPDVVISTGASAGYFALRVAKLFRRRTIWVDSIANADELSLAGKIAEPFADLWLTQWPHLEDSRKIGRRSPRYLGAVL